MGIRRSTIADLVWLAGISIFAVYFVYEVYYENFMPAESMTNITHGAVNVSEIRVEYHPDQQPEIDNPDGLVNFTGMIEVGNSTFRLKVYFVEECGYRDAERGWTADCDGWAKKGSDRMFIVTGNMPTRFQVFGICNHEAYHIENIRSSYAEHHEVIGHAWYELPENIRYGYCYQLLDEILKEEVGR